MICYVEDGITENFCGELSWGSYNMNSSITPSRGGLEEILVNESFWVSGVLDVLYESGGDFGRWCWGGRRFVKVFVGSELA